MPADTEHPSVIDRQPDNPETKIWRYLDLPKLIDLLHTQELHFTQIATLPDPFEGHVPARNHLFWKDPPDLERWATELRRSYTYVSCWSALETESVAMWALYGAFNGGFTIQSTYEKLVTILPANVIVGKVEYIVYEGEYMIAPYNVMNAIVYKRREYRHEDEVRAFIFDTKSLNREHAASPLPFVRIPVNITKLIDAIYIQSTTPDWIYGLLGKLLADYGFEFSLRRSILDEEPTWRNDSPQT